MPPATRAKHYLLLQGRRAVELPEALNLIIQLQDKIRRQKEGNETLRKHNRRLRQQLFRLGKKEEPQGDAGG